MSGYGPVSAEEARMLGELQLNGPLELHALAESTGFDQSRVIGLMKGAAEAGIVSIDEQQREEVIPTKEAADTVSAGLPERHAAVMIRNAGGRSEKHIVRAWAELQDEPFHEIVKFGNLRGWMRQVKEGEGDAQKTYLALTDAGKAASDHHRAEDPDERILRAAKGRPFFIDDVSKHGIDGERVRALLKNRPALAKIKRRTHRVLDLTDAGRAAMPNLQIKSEQTALTSEAIRSGEWKSADMRAYDVSLEAARVVPAKIHPLRKVMQETRRAFLEMGFTEAVSPMVESAFWNFDALYQPQDHPARDMQDTFYMDTPARAALPDAALVDRVRKTHENGWETGSEGWGYDWSAERAREMVLRTHTTATTIRALAAHPEPPYKVFCVGWNFRNETISYKHLPVFHQVDGVVIDKEANLATLLGTLREFYRKMGFEKVRFKPAFYPYTEPSCDVVVYLESRGKWIEMGGSGIFRPEVTKPLGCEHPVLAWGLGIERLAMVRFGMSDIRELFDGRLDALEQVPLCR